MRLETDGFTEGAKISMLAYTWPGNVRELGNRVRRAVLLAESPLLSPKDLGLDASVCDTGDDRRTRLSDETMRKDGLSRHWRITAGISAAWQKHWESAGLPCIKRWISTD